MKINKTGLNILEQNDAYWAKDHTGEYERAKRLFIVLVGEYNKQPHIFSPVERSAFSKIHTLWSSKLYDRYPTDLYTASLEEHELIDLKGYYVWREYSTLMKDFYEHDKIKQYCIHHRKFFEPMGIEPGNNTRGPTGAA